MITPMSTARAHRRALVSGAGGKTVAVMVMARPQNTETAPKKRNTTRGLLMKNGTPKRRNGKRINSLRKQRGKRRGQFAPDLIHVTVCVTWVGYIDLVSLDATIADKCYYTFTSVGQPVHTLARFLSPTWCITVAYVDLASLDAAIAATFTRIGQYMHCLGSWHLLYAVYELNI